MFLLECHGQMDGFTQNRHLKIMQPYESTLKLTRTKESTSSSTILFKNEYHKGTTFTNNCNELFSFARKYFQFLDKAAKNTAFSGIQVNDYSDYAFLRQSICDFFYHIQETLDDMHNAINENGHSKNGHIIISDIKNALVSFRRMLKSIDNLPDYIIQNSKSVLGNKCSLASFNLFHLYLELFWMNLKIVIKYNTIEQIFTQETMEQTSDDHFLLIQPSQANVYTSKNSDIENEVNWVLYNLISLASKCYEKMGAKNVFSCNCVSETWLGVQMLLENMPEENMINFFWYYYNNIIQKYVLNTDVFEESSMDCNNLYRMNKIESKDPLQFSLWLLLNVTQLQGFNNDGDYIGITSLRVVPNYVLLEIILKSLTENDQNIPEIIFREQMNHVNRLLTIWWEPKSEIVTLLWEYFHKRLNSAFSVPGREDCCVSLQSSSVPEIANDLKTRFSLDVSFKKDYKQESSFSFFITLLGLHLKKSVLSNQQNNCQRIKGRILPKFTVNKIVALNDLGLKNFSTVFLVMAVATDLVNICSKLQELMSQLVFDSLPWNKKLIVMKTHLVVIYLYIENNINITKAVTPVTHIMTKHGISRDSESMSLAKLVIGGIQDILDVSTNFEHDEHILIDSWISKYMSSCPLSDTSNTLDMFMSLLSKLRILCAYSDELNESVSMMTQVFFTHIFTCVKSLYSNGVSALQLADIAFSFTKLIFDNSAYVKQYGSFEDHLKYFIFSENANERVSRHFLLLILQDEDIVGALEREKACCEPIIVHSWIKCTLLSTEGPSDSDSHLMNMVCQLRNFSTLKITQDYNNSGEQIYLCKFFYAIGTAWKNSQTFQEKCRLRDQVNQYLINVDKYIVIGLKSPPSLEYVMQMFIVLGTLFLHCSPIIYSRAKPNCLLHSLVSNVLLPPQIFMDKKLHPYITPSVCKSWYMFMKGLHQLDYKNDAYIEKAMKDMILQYLPFFACKTLSTKNVFYDIPYRMIPNDTNSDLVLEKYILDRISMNYITCRGKQSHVHAPKALSIIHNIICNSTNVNLLKMIITSTLPSVLEQLMFADVGSPNSKIAGLILETVCKSPYYRDTCNEDSIRLNIKEMLTVVCKKHLAFNSSPFFKLLLGQISLLGNVMDDFIPYLESEITKVEKMRGVGYDYGLRNGLKEILLQTKTTIHT